MRHESESDILIRHSNRIAELEKELKRYRNAYPRLVTELRRLIRDYNEAVDRVHQYMDKNATALLRELGEDA